MRIDYVKSSNKEEAFKSVKAGITPELLEKFQVKADISDNGTDRIDATGKGFDFKVDFLNDHILLDLNLSFMLKPFKSKILGYLEKEVKKII